MHFIIQHTTYMKSYMFWYRGAIRRESYKPTCHIYVFFVVINIIKMLDY